MALTGARQLRTESLYEARVSQRFESGDIGHFLTIAAVEEQSQLQLSPDAANLLGDHGRSATRSGWVVDIDRYTVGDTSEDQIDWRVFFTEAVSYLRDLKKEIADG